MPKEIPPSSFECDCGHQLDFFESTVQEMEVMSQKKKVQLGDHTDHTVVFFGGKMVDMICPNKKKSAKKPMATSSHKWTFTSRFRRNAFGWRSQPAITRVKEAVSEIKKVTRKDPILAAEGAVKFIEKLVPAIEAVDGSSGAIGTAVYNAIEDLVKIIATADVDAKQRDKWLKRLWQAFEDDGISYIESLGDHWGTLCGSSETASQWADSFLFQVRRHWQEGWKPGHYYNGVTPCLACLLVAGRHQELLDLLDHSPNIYWHYHRYGFLAMAAMGQNEEALKFAEKCRSPNDEHRIDRDCEDFLISIGEVERAYKQYAMRTNESNTRINTFRAVAKKYPNKDKAEILMDLIGSTPGSEGKWFATARKLGFMDLALHLAQKSPCDPKTLNRAAKDTVGDYPEFALGVAKASLHWLCEGWGYEITSLDVLEPYRYALQAAELLEIEQQVRQDIAEMVDGAGKDGKFVKDVLGRHLR